MKHWITTIQRRLMADLGLLILLTGGTILAATWSLGSQTIEQQSAIMIDRTGRRTETELERFFKTVEAHVLIGGDRAADGILDPTDYQAMNTLFLPILRQYPQLSSMMVADSAGAEYLLLRDPLDPEVWTNRIVEADRLGTRVFNRTWNSESEEVKEGYSELDYDPRKRIWYEQALLAIDNEQVFWTAPVIFYVTKDPGITASTRIVTNTNPPRTIVVAYDLLLMDISKFTTNLKVSDRGKGFVLVEDRQKGGFQVVGLPGDERYQSDESIRKALVSIPPERAVADTDAQLPTPDSLQIPSLTAVMATWESQGRPQQPVRFSAEGENWWGGLRSFTLGDNIFWIGVVVPEQDLSSSIRMQQWLMMGIVLGVLVIGMVRVVTLAREFSAPIKKLVEQSERISRGDLEPGTVIESDFGEIRRLAEAHENMREGLKSVIKLEKLERDLDIAREIQLGLLPDASPLTPGFEVAGWNRPADKTGGDYFDWLTLPDGRTLFTLADVAGHGIGPALIVAVYRAYIRASSGDGKSALSAVIGRLNDLLCEDMPEGRFITAAIGQLNPAENQVELLSAGQAPILFYESATHTLHNWEADDLPLGIAAGVEFSNARRIAFKPGDMLVLTTDGFFEAANAADEAFGIQALEQFIRDHHQLSPAELIAQLYRQIEIHVAGEEQGDDLTALIVKRSEVPGHQE